MCRFAVAKQEFIAHAGEAWSSVAGRSSARLLRDANILLWIELGQLRIAATGHNITANNRTLGIRLQLISKLSLRARLHPPIAM